MKFPLLITVFFLTTVSCNEMRSKKLKVEDKDTVSHSRTDESLFGYKISWSDSSKVVYEVDTLLTYKDKGLFCDSAVAIDYTGFLGEHFYLPVNDKGQWINTIEKRRKLTDGQLQLIQSVLGDKKSFDNPIIISCYEPRLGIVYFKGGKVIGQSAICLSCARLESTAKLGNGDHYSSFNERTLKRLENLCIDLQFSNCKQAHN